MAKFYFADGKAINIDIKPSDSIKRSINKYCGTSSCRNITDEIHCYDLSEEEQKLVNEHPDCDFYQTYDCVSGSWDQHVEILAVEI